MSKFSKISLEEVSKNQVSRSGVTKNVTILFFNDSYSVVSRSSRAKQYKILVERPSTLKNHCELKSGLTDKPDTVLESSDDSEQNQWGWFFDIFGKIFCTGPLC